MEQAHICRFERQMVVKAHIYCWKKNINSHTSPTLKELLLKSQALQKLLQYQVKSNNVFVFPRKHLPTNRPEASASPAHRARLAPHCLWPVRLQLHSSQPLWAAGTCSQNPPGFACGLRIYQTLVKKIREKLKRKPKEKIQEFRWYYTCFREDKSLIIAT